MPDLSTRRLRPLSLPDATLHCLSRLDLPGPAQALLARLVDETPWRTETITLWGKSYPQPRLSAWYGDPGNRYRYSGLDLDPLPWTALLSCLRGRVEAAAGCPFNSVLLNYYRDHHDAMGLHSDDEPELGPEPVIASLSLGETRTFVLRHRRRKDLAPVRIPLHSGSLLVMRGTTQANWKHGIPRQRSACEGRVNLTFRRILEP